MLNTLKTNVIMYLCSGLKNRKAAGADGIPPEALKAVDSVDRSTIWKLMEHYRIPSKFNCIIRNLYDNATCHVIDVTSI